jgi:hypothetical protein
MWHLSHLSLFPRRGIPLVSAFTIPAPSNMIIKWPTRITCTAISVGFTYARTWSLTQQKNRKLPQIRPAWGLVTTARVVSTSLRRVKHQKWNNGDTLINTAFPEFFIFSNLWLWCLGLTNNKQNRMVSHFSVRRL